LAKNGSFLAQNRVFLAKNIAFCPNIWPFWPNLQRKHSIVQIKKLGHKGQLLARTDRQTDRQAGGQTDTCTGKP